MDSHFEYILNLMDEKSANVIMPNVNKVKVVFSGYLISCIHMITAESKLLM